MGLTDAQIYEQHPDIKAMNDEYVALGQQVPALANAVAAAGDLVTEANAQRREAIRVATEAVQVAQKVLAQVKAKHTLDVTKANGVYDEAVSEQKRVTARRNEVQQRHNEAIDAVQAENATADEPQE